MKNFAQINVSDIFKFLLNKITKISKTQIIIFVVLVVAACVIYPFTKFHMEKKDILNKAQKIITEISNNQKKFFEENKKYDKDYFKNNKISETPSASYKKGDKNNPSRNERHKRRFANKKEEEKEGEFSSSKVGNFFVEINAEKACVVLKYKKDTSEKTIFFASFEDAKPACIGIKCLKENMQESKSICYQKGECFVPFLVEKTEQSCGDNHGKQTRNCSPDCNGGKCDAWTECTCDIGYGWNGKTCVQLQTEKDCTDEQCFNGIFCEDKEPLKKEIENGTCQRAALCQKKGWRYSNWRCSCPDENLCALKEQCTPKPENQKTLELPNQQGNCSDILYTCQEGDGWQSIANKCTCKTIGTFWDKQLQKTICSECTQKPKNSHFITAGTDKDNCSWECDTGFENRGGKCVEPNGQYVCARMNSEICTDDFSKNRTLKKDTSPNEGKPCFTEDNENILFYTKKTNSCILCQCYDFSK